MTPTKLGTNASLFPLLLVGYEKIIIISGYTNCGGYSHAFARCLLIF